MKSRVIVDTGPLVAFINRNDTFHEWTKSQLALIKPPLITCEAVLSEACFLLRQIDDANSALLEEVKRGLITINFSLSEEIHEVKKLLSRYKNVPISLADACLVKLSEKYADSPVFTLDSDFLIYRRHGRQVIPTILPPI